MIVKREITRSIKQMAKKYAVITITGPRQSGKTTLAKTIFPNYKYYSLEDPDIRDLAFTDPRKFLSNENEGLVLDEIQKAPELLSYIQGIVDNEKKPGRYIITGSQQFELLNNVTQSLAGRTAIFKLLPFTIYELRHIIKKQSSGRCIFQGFYPGVHDKKIQPAAAYKNYFETYIERDLRQMINIKDLRLFRKFVKLCAGRIGQLFSASSLANDIGVSVPTINSWISILEASFIIMFLEPYYKNTGKRLIKSPKLYFTDTGLASYLLGIENEKQLERDPLRGNLFENLVLLELVKKRYNLGLDHNLFFYRDSNGQEVDILYKTAGILIPAEIKAADTFTTEFLKGLDFIKRTIPQNTGKGYIIYSGKIEKDMGNFSLINFENSEKIINDKHTL